MKKRIYKNLLALTLACSVALSTAPVSSFARDVAAVSESEATTEAPKEKATEVEKKTEVSKDATTVTEKTEASEEKTTAAEKTEAPEEKTIAAEKTEAETSEEKTTSKKTKTSEKKATDPECVKPDKPVVDGPTPEGKKDTDEATKPSTVTLHFNQSMPGHVLSVSKASSFNFGGYASDKKATVKASYVGIAWNGKGYSSSTPSYKAGTYTETLYVTDAAYSATPISRTYTITRANTHIIINNPVDCTYDGSAFAVDATVYDDNNNEVTKANVTYIRVDGGKYIYLGFTAPVEAGAYIAIATYPGDATHRPSAAKSFFIIHPKAVKVNIDYKEKYVGDKDPELTYKAEGVLDGDSLGLKLTREAGEEAGYYDIYPDTSSLNPNYKLAETPDGTDHFHILKRDSGETPNPGTTETPNPGTTETPNPGTTETPNPGTTETPDPGTTETPADDSSATTTETPADDSSATTTETPSVDPSENTDPTTKTTKKTTTQKKANTKKATTKKNKKSKSSKTGDASNPVLYMVVSVFALVMCAFIVLRRRTDR
ncbi:DNA repair protein RAD4 [Anaerobutyricum hallii]|uniref:DNA repair protein RAD4 n=1 Tax=Anaerobutyricum hallii TaxID=39488 RepID=A0A173SWS5_9FIRM|nr:MBG domain-containing protein [Anaerobutyricum hallii]CUM93588.1 DNA repair protein RAD4 [Anaerobutyricum hallii]